MADDNETNTAFDRDTFVKQAQGELSKQKKDSLKSKIKELLKKKDEALKAVAVIDKEIDDELNRFENGLS